MGLLDAPGLNRGDLARLRVRSLPGIAGLPAVMSSPPTYARGSANGSSTISGAVLMNAPNLGAFMYMGASPLPDANGAMTANGSNQSVTSANAAPPWVAEFWCDAPKLDVKFQAAGSGYQMIVNGSLVSGTPYTDSNDGNVYNDDFDWSSSRTMRHYRLEMSGNFKFRGIVVGPTDTIYRAAPADPVIVMGDSFTEPTIVDSVVTARCGHEGWASTFARLAGFKNIWCSGSGGTGYLNNGGGGGKYKFRDRVVADLIDKDPAAWFIAGGINDAGREPTTTAQDVYTEAVALFAQIKAALPYSQGGAFSPFWSNGSPTGSLRAHQDALAAAAAACNLDYFDVMGMTPSAARVSTTLAATVGSGGATSTISVNATIGLGSRVRIGTPLWGASPGTIPLRTVTGVSGSGPYTLTLSANVGTAFTAGTAVVSMGDPWVTGTGRQGTTTGSGSADLFIGSDQTHPTVAGHAALGRAAFSAFVDSLSL